MHEPRIFFSGQRDSEARSPIKVTCAGNKDNITQYYSLLDDNVYCASDAR